jgi:hypothetical protein
VSSVSEVWHTIGHFPGASPGHVTLSGYSPSLAVMRAVQITRFGAPEVLEITDVPAPTPGPGQQLYDVSTAGINYADAHHHLS